MMHLLTPQSLAIIGVLFFLEGILSIDNALVLAILAKQLPAHQQKKALSYGLVGAVIFRFIAIGLAKFLMHWQWLKLVGGAYLLWLAYRHFFAKAADGASAKKAPTSFWKAILVIELTDIAFAVDSILAAVALTPDFWLIFIGGILGVGAMRFAAAGFIKLLHRFPGFEISAYALVAVIGLKVILEGLRIPGLDFHSPAHVSFWIFWSIIAICLVGGLFKKPQDKTTA